MVDDNSVVFKLMNDLPMFCHLRCVCSTLLGPKADHFAFEECLESVGSYGKAEHIMVSVVKLCGVVVLLLCFV